MKECLDILRSKPDAIGRLEHKLRARGTWAVCIKTSDRQCE